MDDGVMNGFMMASGGGGDGVEGIKEEQGDLGHGVDYPVGQRAGRKALPIHNGAVLSRGG